MYFWHKQLLKELIVFEHNEETNNWRAQPISQPGVSNCALDEREIKTKYPLLQLQHEIATLLFLKAAVMLPYCSALSNFT